ncbi:MAG TPA: N-acetyl-gamma-glutamyl-phosphate reductase [Gammaproteobacteria bacterium]|nr:N-acetyl-gamma-glutamyl-phosphate reductase [Gammaproteobacteria bacterium]
MTTPTVPVIVLGGSGYVAGEVLRLIAQHPRLGLGAAVSTSAADQAIAKTFAHLHPSFPAERFASIDSTIERLGEAPRWIVVSAAPHGASAPLVARLLESAARAGVELAVVDASADFRFRSADQYAEIYHVAHAAPQLLDSFRCAVPEHLAEIDTPHVAQPGCFATAMLLAIVPLVAKGLSGPEFSVSAITGSTGAGGTPRETTHHPVRQSNVFAYQPLKHRHDPEVRALTEAATGRAIGLHFVPHSGPFARGIHATVFALRTTADSPDAIREAVADYYRDAAFVRVLATPPRLKDVVGTNFASLSVDADDRVITVCCAIDNLVKGAAGGALQWVNRLCGWPDTDGLTAAAPGWI